MSIFKNPFARLISISPTPNTSIKLNSEQVKDFKTFFEPPRTSLFTLGESQLSAQADAECIILPFLKVKCIHVCFLQPVVCAAFYLVIAVFQKIPTHSSSTFLVCEMRHLRCASHIASEPPALFIAHTHLSSRPRETIS